MCVRGAWCMDTCVDAGMRALMCVWMRMCLSVLALRERICQSCVVRMRYHNEKRKISLLKVCREKRMDQLVSASSSE